MANISLVGIVGGDSGAGCPRSDAYCDWGETISQISNAFDVNVSGLARCMSESLTTLVAVTKFFNERIKTFRTHLSHVHSFEHIGHFQSVLITGFGQL